MKKKKLSFWKRAEALVTNIKYLSYPRNYGSGVNFRNQDTFLGSFQQHYYELTSEEVLAYSTVYAALSAISNTISKLPMGLYRYDDNGTKTDITNTANGLVVRNPAPNYNQITWKNYLVNSLMITGNAYAIKRFDGAMRVKSLSLLHPDTVTPLISPRGDVFYRIDENRIAGISEDRVSQVIPAYMVAHWRYNPFLHPLVGTSPLQAALNPARTGTALTDRARTLHSERPRTGGVIQAPEEIDQQQADRIAQQWKTAAASGVLVLDNGIEFKPLTFNAQEMETIAAMEQADKMIARAFGVPEHMLGIGEQPTVGNSQVIIQNFYNTTLQPIIEIIELTLNEALGLEGNDCVEFDTSVLARLDTAARYTSLTAAVAGKLMTINEARKLEGLPPQKGGDVIRVQMQDVPLDRADELLDQSQQAPMNESEDDSEDEEDPPMRDRGVYVPGKEYKPGHVVTLNGTWVCKKTTKQTPGNGSDWRLVAKGR